MLISPSVHRVGEFSRNPALMIRNPYALGSRSDVPVGDGVADQGFGREPDGPDDATEREYVCGAGDADEFIAQLEWADPGEPDPPAVWYYLQDASNNVVTVLDDAGNVARQYAWTPYGEPAAVDDLPGP